MDLVKHTNESAAKQNDPRLQPTPDYGSLGPNSDIQRGQALGPEPARLRPLIAILVGVICALPFLARGSVRAAWEQLSHYLTLQGKPEPASPAIMSQHELQNLDRQPVQKQAELLLERAINHYDGATDQIAARVERWRLRRLKLTQHLNSLLTAAFNSNDLRVRAAAIEIDLAAINVAKVPSNVEVFEKEAESSDKSVRNWGLWTLGLLGNRGVDTERVTQVLIAHLRDSDQDARHWAVEALALVGTDEIIPPLLQTFHDDPSPMVRERAACSLAQSGMLTEQQRRTAIPELLKFADDPALDAQTHTWVFHALRDITGQNLPNEAAAWRNWYSSAGGI
jgi:HEAT repeat protein